ncbi:MAG: hypothetical protein J1E78_05230 [Muribaculaceae bacterium]|nr:hypothetical protein [Muribaculaceae bacterium]
MRFRLTIVFALFVWMLFTQSCIHDHPTGETVNPENIDAELEVTFDLRWSQALHIVDFGTKAGERGNLHKFILEAWRDGVTYCRDVVTLSDDEFAMGVMRHTFSKPLAATNYRIGVWYEKTGDEVTSPYFQTDDLSHIKLLTNSTTHGDSIQCGFGLKDVDFSKMSQNSSRDSEVMTIELEHPGARFHIVATDIRQFIDDNRSYLLQGDSFFVNLSLSQNRHNGFNIYSSSVKLGEGQIERSSGLWLPFADYDELKIADGFLFTDPEEDVTLTLSITNTTGMVISRTEPFSFPVKRGVITTVRGDFLSFPINGSLTVNPVWDGEIELEY